MKAEAWAGKQVLRVGEVGTTQGEGRRGARAAGRENRRSESSRSTRADKK